jgi:hypothetical protein
VLARVVNLLVPIYYKKIVDELTPGGAPLHFPVANIFIYTVLRFLQVRKWK